MEHLKSRRYRRAARWNGSPAGIIARQPNPHQRAVKLTEKCRKRALKPHCCWEAKRSFRMGVAGWRFAHRKGISGRAAVVAALEELPVICSLAVAAGSMIMIGIMLYRDWPQ
jgi:hypothetical protein